MNKKILDNAYNVIFIVIALIVSNKCKNSNENGAEIITNENNSSTERNEQLDNRQILNENQQTEKQVKKNKKQLLNKEEKGKSSEIQNYIDDIQTSITDKALIQAANDLNNLISKNKVLKYQYSKQINDIINRLNYIKELCDFIKKNTKKEIKRKLEEEIKYLESETIIYTQKTAINQAIEKAKQIIDDNGYDIESFKYFMLENELYKLQDLAYQIHPNKKAH